MVFNYIKNTPSKRKKHKSQSNSFGGPALSPTLSSCIAEPGIHVYPLNPLETCVGHGKHPVKLQVPFIIDSYGTLFHGDSGSPDVVGT